MWWSREGKRPPIKPLIDSRTEAIERLASAMRVSQIELNDLADKEHRELSPREALLATAYGEMHQVLIQRAEGNRATKDEKRAKLQVALGEWELNVMSEAALSGVR
jgi:hypothetical protein